MSSRSDASGLPAAVDLNEIMGSRLGGWIKSAFDCMEMAEEEIARAQKRFPDKKQEIWESFMLLSPTEVLEGKTDRVYRAHARELLERVGRGQDTRKGTAAELLCAMLAAATAAPLNAQGAALTERLFTIVMGRKLDEEGAFRPVWKGQVEEAYEWAAKRVYFDWRKPGGRPPM